MAGKSGFMKDAFILFAITLISGLALGGVYEVTKEPIEQATIAANNATYQSVLPEASSFEEDTSLASSIETCNTELAGMDFGNVGVDSVLIAKDSSGAEAGYVINTHSNDSYGGPVEISVGFNAEGSISAIGFLAIDDTPGLGLKAKEPAFKDQYVGKNADALTVTKSGNAGETEINSISGATITSSATTNAVNAALYFLHNYLN
ncbi:FMN-binding protein [Clostridium sp. M62/1]|uniref:FMN-binding protein n=1 Tax=unclassified Clostridium TaxID=2614128 RepID=UPI00019734F2|nr:MULTISPECIES: FMN-binding protein [unclassified Clostridium]MBS5467214.1 FMN-binding protein [Clostridium sp.]CBL35713.1 Predicted NADH:ubiquinone oxidoreductase, subunit RnfG [butyrate-producing bacterium SM4/1]CCY83254.1 predicted NADH:ubiquinone oxidoreductase subunit RnfG [Clostridium sp. CAG:149]EFE13603.1 electron transport complex, RnfABCDGE type, G subunit [Clostridium sp. M62/1]RHT57936.1 FMN-binding protein [Clostridium sp. AM29-11AC]